MVVAEAIRHAVPLMRPLIHDMVRVTMVVMALVCPHTVCNKTA